MIIKGQRPEYGILATSLQAHIIFIVTDTMTNIMLKADLEFTQCILCCD